MCVCGGGGGVSVSVRGVVVFICEGAKIVAFSFGFSVHFIYTDVSVVEILLYKLANPLTVDHTSFSSRLGDWRSTQCEVRGARQHWQTHSVKEGND